MNRKQKKMLARILLSAILMLALHFVPLSGTLRFFLYLIPYLVIGYDILIKAVRGIFNRQVFDENFLMAIATVGALLIGVFQTGEYVEAVSVMLFYQVGEWFQSYAVGKSRRSISRLMDIRPDYANVEDGDSLRQVSPEEVAAGTVIVVNPGERVPIDGVVEDGVSSLNTSALTGESLPRDVSCGDEVISGCINLTGVLKIRTTKEFEESTVARILDLVENASSRKSRSEAFITRFARYYTPAVCLSALLLSVLPPLFGLVFSVAVGPWSQWIYRALTFLVISCPCALVISIPLSFFAGLGGAGKAGVLVKGSNFLEALSKASTVVFDKTGTLTRGVFEVSHIESPCMPSGQLLEYAALAESASSHPISKSLLRAYGKEAERSRVSGIREISGFGVSALVDGAEVLAGNQRLMEEKNIACPPCEKAGTLVYVSVNGSYAGCIVISDQLKPTACQAISALEKAGVRKKIMLTGDSESAARQAASELGLDGYFSQLLPEDKVRRVEEMLALEKKGGKLVFVGDGVNDAPVLSRADIGIAMGAMGSDAAIEAADVVLMDDDPLKIARAIQIARKCMTIVYENIVFAIGIKIICLLLGALGFANMWLAIFADVGVMILAVLNAIRALSVPKSPQSL